MKPRVFVTQIPARLEEGIWTPTVDITAVREFGEPRIMLPMGFSATDGAELQAIFNGHFATFDPTRDFYLPMGDPFTMTVAAALLARWSVVFNMLRWDRIARRYFKFEVKA